LKDAGTERPGNLGLEIGTYKEIFLEPSFIVLSKPTGNTVTIQSRTPKTVLFLLTSPLLSIGMKAAAPIYNIQSSADGCYRAPSPTPSLSPTLINNPHYTERPSLKLSFPCGVSNILNSAVIDAASQSLYSISSNSKRTTMVSCRDNVELATVQWNHHSPRMVFRGKKMKCKEWLKLAGPDNEYMPVSRNPP
jgi:hypothetical protein